MTNILLVFTGGTIGSIASNGTVNTDTEQNYRLLSLFKQNHSSTGSINFKTLQPVQLLSENLFPSIWETLINAIEAENISQYDGIIITHGTDTLAYTAAALSLYFNSIATPILLVSSNYPLDHPQANGLVNFNCAVEFIKQREQGGVFVPYQNPNSDTLIHLGSRLSSCLPLSGDFISVQSKAYLKFENNTFQQVNPLNTSTCIATQLKPVFSKKILLIKPYPGLDYSHFQLEQVDAILHDLYHSGTACSTNDWGGNNSLTIFIQQCTLLNIPVYMAPAIHSHDAYDSTQVLLQHGGKMIWNMSLEVAYVKLLLAYGNFTDCEQIDQFLTHNIAFEYIA
jgi:L-asparaginase